METMVHSKKSVSTKVSKEYVPIQQDFPIEECDVKIDPIGQPELESDKKIRLPLPMLGILLHPKTSDSATLAPACILLWNVFSRNRNRVLNVMNVVSVWCWL